ncbi:MAG: hypothetical protein LBJ35_05845, partial [Spirochaetaceae bacterium]|nr:hypothetical protein [Spirochaetaceae bacterium]
VETDITVTFKNGWEDIAEGQIKDDEYTEGGPYKKLSPEKVKAVVDKTELETYNAAYTEWERVAGLWDDYNTKLEAYQNNPSGESPPPPKKI